MSHRHAPYVTAHDLGLTLSDGRRLFGGLTFSLADGRTGLVGANGVGKSLLLDVLAGVRPASEGRVLRRGHLAYVPQGRARTSDPGETVADRLCAAAAGALHETALGAELGRAGLGHLSPDRPMMGLSGGEASRVTLLAAMLERPDVLLLDEPTNDLDDASRRAFLDLLERWGGGLLMVSHDRDALRRVDRIMEMTPRGVSVYGGDYDAYRAARDVEIAAQEAELSGAEAARRTARAEAARVRERQARRASRGKRARKDGGMPKILLNARRSRSQATTGRVGAAMDGVEEAARARVAEARERVDEAAAPRMEVAPSGLPAGKDVLILDAVAYTPPGAAAPVLEGVSLVLRGPERVALAGPNGSGKTTLLGIALGRIEPQAGVVRRALPPERVAYLDQKADTLPPGATVLDSFRAAHPSMEEGYARHVLARYLFSGDAARTPVLALSGGERVRAALACLLGGPAAPALLVLDEPTNHLDFRSLEAVERAVAGYDGALLAVSHDADFLAAVGVERVIELERM